MKKPEMMDVIINGRIEQRRVVDVESIRLMDGQSLPGIQTPETFYGEEIVQTLDGTHIVKVITEL